MERFSEMPEENLGYQPPEGNRSAYTDRLNRQNQQRIKLAAIWASGNRMRILGQADELIQRLDLALSSEKDTDLITNYQSLRTALTETIDLINSKP